MGRLPRSRLHPWRRGRGIAEPQREERFHEPLRDGRPSSAAGGTDSRLRPRRRGLQARRQWARELLRHAAGIGDARLLRLRSARAGRRAARRPPPDRAPQAPRETARAVEVGRPERYVRRRGSVARGGVQAGPGRSHGQAGRLALRPGPVAAVAKGEGAAAAGVRRRRLHEGTAQTRADGRARGRRPRPGRAALGGQCRRGLLGGRDRRAPCAPEAARTAGFAARDGAEDAPRPDERPHMGGAGARGGGRVRRVDARRSSPCACLSRDTRRQAARGGPPRGSVPHGDPEGQEDPEAFQPRQALLARRRDHEGRSARVLPRDRARDPPPPPRPAVHDEALPRRHRRQVLLPEGRAEAHARVDPDTAVRGLDAREPASAPADRRAARERRAARCCGW